MSLPTDEISRRDWFLLPLIGVLTILILLLSCELTARLLWPQAEHDSCVVRTKAGLRFRPNCSSPMKAAEGPWTINSYNECGYRTTAHCGPKAVGTLRIAFLGSSMTMGEYVTYPQTFATRIGNAVAHDLKQPVEVENLAVFGFTPLDSYRRLGEAMGLQPDVVVFPIAPTDLAGKLDPEQVAQRDNPNAQFSKLSAVEKHTAFDSIHHLLVEDSTIALVSQHFMFQRTTTAVRTFLDYGDKADFVRQPFSPAWRSRFNDVQALVNEMSAKLQARKVPLVLVAIPSRIEAALLNPEFHRPHVDPYAFGDRIREMAVQSGAIYVDLLHPFSQVARPEDFYFVVNNHLTGDGHALIARQVAPVVEHVLAQQMAVRRARGVRGSGS